MPGHRIGPQLMRPCCVVVSRADALRLDRFIVRVGIKRAPEILGIGPATLESARDEGRMLAKTRDRLFAALDRAEAS